MSRWATGVTVVGAAHDGRTAGMVASSFTSVSADPPTVLVAVSLRSRTLPVIEASGAFAVSILSSAQDQAFRVFAGITGEVPDRFAAAGDDIWSLETGSPILAGSLAWFDCRLVTSFPGATSHVILVGEVLASGVHADPGTEPLLYFARSTRRLGDT